MVEELCNRLHLAPTSPLVDGWLIVGAKSSVERRLQLEFCVTCHTQMRTMRDAGYEHEGQGVWCEKQGHRGQSWTRLNVASQRDQERSS